MKGYNCGALICLLLFIKCFFCSFGIVFYIYLLNYLFAYNILKFFYFSLFNILILIFINSCFITNIFGICNNYDIRFINWYYFSFLVNLFLGYIINYIFLFYNNVIVLYYLMFFIYKMFFCIFNSYSCNVLIIKLCVINN